MNIELETAQFLFAQKVAFINTVAHVSMIWWVSTVALCVSILAAVWLKKDELKEQGLIKWIGPALFFAFSTIIFYGLLIIFYLNQVQEEISALATILKTSSDYSTELYYFRLAMINGTSSFVMVWIAWIVLWRKLLKNRVPKGPAR